MLESKITYWVALIYRMFIINAGAFYLAKVVLDLNLDTPISFQQVIIAWLILISYGTAALFEFVSSMPKEKEK